MCQQGFDDALHFLHRNNLIGCTRCLAIQSTFVLSKQTPENFDPECITCTTSREKLMKDKKMPEQVMSAMSKYIEDSNNGLLKWFRKPAVLVLKTLDMPVTIPCDVAYATLTKLLATAPSVKKTFWSLTQFVMANLHQLFIPSFGYGNSETVVDNDGETKYKNSSMYDDDQLLKQFKHLEHRKSIMSLVDVEDSDFEVSGGMLSKRKSILSGRNSVQPFKVSSIPSTDDTLDQVVNVCAANSDTSIYSYHYNDEIDKTLYSEREKTELLQYNESDLRALHNNHDLLVIHSELAKILYDWKCAEINMDEFISDPNADYVESRYNYSSVDRESFMDSFFKPEADQKI